jgi:nucleolar pre-ribosomal-associated protein 1
MGKRTIFDADTKSAHGGHDIKRQRIQGSHERNSPRPNGGAEEVTTARDLQTALLFDQRAHGEFRNGTSHSNTPYSFTCSPSQV